MYEFINAYKQYPIGGRRELVTRRITLETLVK